MAQHGTELNSTARHHTARNMTSHHLTSPHTTSHHTTSHHTTPPLSARATHARTMGTWVAAGSTAATAAQQHDTQIIVAVQHGYDSKHDTQQQQHTNIISSSSRAVRQIETLRRQYTRGTVQHILAVRLCSTSRQYTSGTVQQTLAVRCTHRVLKLLAALNRLLKDFDRLRVAAAAKRRASHLWQYARRGRGGST